MRVRFPRFLSPSAGLEVYDVVAAAGRLLLWLVKSEGENEVVKVISNFTTLGATPLLLLITTKRVLLLKVTEIAHPLIVFTVAVDSRGYA